MTQKEIIERIQYTLKESSYCTADWETVSAETTVGSLGFDSLTILDVIYDMQQQFGIDFDPEELVSVNTVGELAAFIEDELTA